MKSLPLGLPCAALLAPAAFPQATFAPQEVLGFVAGIYDLTTLDGDGDGDQDLVGVSSNGRVYYFENLPDGTLSQAQQVGSAGTLQTEVRAADLDGDGFADLVVAAETTGSLFWQRSLGNGLFDPPATIADPGFRCRSVSLVDLDADGDVDVVTADQVSTIGWYENTGGGAFAPFAAIATGPSDQIQSVRAADVDQDGFLDIVVGSSNDDRIVLHRATGAATFGAPTPLTSSAGGLRHLELADLDGDGDLDIVYAARDDDEIGVLLGNGAGGFAAVQVVDGALDGAESVTVVDVDLDGNPDLLATANIAQRVVLYRGLGFGFFGLAEDLTGAAPHTALGPTTVVALDVDGDQDLDVVSASISDSKVALYRNVATTGTVFCAGNPNSTGALGRIALTGSGLLSANRLAVTATDLPLAQFGIFFASRTADNVPNPGGSAGVLCLGGDIGRYVGPGQILFTGSTGSMRLVLDLGGLQSSTGPMAGVVGQTWRFQAWHRDVDSGVATSNFSEAAAVVLR